MRHEQSQVALYKTHTHTTTWHDGLCAHALFADLTFNNNYCYYLCSALVLRASMRNTFTGRIGAHTVHRVSADQFAARLKLSQCTRTLAGFIHGYIWSCLFCRRTSTGDQTHTTIAINPGYKQDKKLVQLPEIIIYNQY